MSKKPGCLHCALKRAARDWCVEYTSCVGDMPADADLLSALAHVASDIIRQRPAGPLQGEAVQAVKQILDLHMAEPDGAPH